MLRERRRKRLLPRVFEGAKEEKKTEEHQINQVPPDLVEGLKVKYIPGRARKRPLRRIFK